MFDWKEPQSHDIITSYTNTIRETRDTKEERFDQKISVLRPLRKFQSVLRGNDGMNEGEEEGDEVNHLIVAKLLRYFRKFHSYFSPISTQLRHSLRPETTSLTVGLTVFFHEYRTCRPVLSLW